MKRNSAVDATLPLPGIARPVGRSRKPDAKTNAQRQAAFRKRHQNVDAGETMTATIRRFAKDFDLTEGQVTRELLRFALCNRNWNQTGFPLQRNEKGKG
ncbi:MAG: hypothetical protein FWF12_04030 [Betaproteobacteria bacterium]|nr:hypothetical protein [Betaproteobacteria bacterium]